MVAGVVLFAPFFASAQALTDLFAQDTQILSSCFDLKYNLGYRSRDTSTNGEVSDLQEFLVTNGYLSGDPTGYFGTATLVAVKKFQVAVGIGNTTTPGYGRVGPKSRAKIKVMTCGDTTVTKSLAPQRDPDNTLYEKVKCLFKSQTEQKCWPETPVILADSPFRNYGCSGVGSCLANVKGLEGTPITWWSSCGGSANTTIDGTNEYASFGDCSVIVSPTPTTTPSFPAGCRSTVGFSVTTRKRCIDNASVPSIRVLSPNGGETYTLESDMKVNWSVSNMPTGGYVVAQLEAEGGQFTLGTTYQQNGTDNYYLSAKNNIVPGNYKVRLHIAGIPENLSAMDSSDSYFRILGSTITTTVLTPTLTVVSSGGGTVSSSPAGINCGSGGITCIANFPANTQVALTASPKTGNSFTGWSGSCAGTGTTCYITMYSNSSVTPIFAPITESVASAPTLIFTATPSIVTAGQSAVLSWSSTNATSCTTYLQGTEQYPPQNFSLSGSEAGTFYETRTHIVTCTGPGGTITKSVTITVN